MATKTLHIPTIGEQLLLADDWTFTVTAEYRNDHLWQHLIATGVLPPDADRWEAIPPRCGQLIERTYRVRADVPGVPYWQQTDMIDRTVQEPCGLEAGHDGEHNPRHHEPRDYARVQCTVPRGATLTVDRIYIRKGKQDYDSLTFWATGLGAKKIRFWAKLADVNRIRVTDAPVRQRKAKAEPLVMRAIILRD
jgi:hypothetical protein